MGLSRRQLSVCVCVELKRKAYIDNRSEGGFFGQSFHA